MMDMFGNMKAHQDQMAAKLSAVQVVKKSEDGLVEIKVNGHKEVLDLSINAEKWIDHDLDQLQDVLIATLNNAFEEVDHKSEEITSQALNDLIPGGMGGLGSLFGGA